MIEDKFSLNQYTQKIEHIYNELLSGRPVL